MTTEVVETEQNYGPRMLALGPLQRRLVEVYLDHPNWTKTQCAIAAGYSTNGAQTRSSINFRDEKVIAAINEEASKRLRRQAALAIGALEVILLNPQHKDHAKAINMVLDRTGFHATTEHKVIVDDKRPETKAELIAAVQAVAKEAGLSDDAIKQLVGGDDSVIDVREAITVEFTEVDPEVEDM